MRLTTRRIAPLNHLVPLPTSRLCPCPQTGASGTGRTTFINTLVEESLLPHRSDSLLTDPSNPNSPLDPVLVRQAAEHAHEEEAMRIKPYNIELEEDGVRIALTIVDTPGFGDAIDNESS